MFHTQSCLCSFSIPFPADPSLTSSAVLSSLETMDDLWRLFNYILGLPDVSTSGIKSKEACVQLYLQTSPYASWEHLAGQLFMCGYPTELEKVKKRMKPVRGQYNYVLYTIQPCRGSYT